MQFEFEGFLKKYKKLFIEIYNKKETTKSVKLQKDIREKIKEFKQNNYKEFKKIHNQLKPLHGHPNNKELLSEIKNNMDEKLSNLKENIANAFTPLRVKIKLI